MTSLAVTLLLFLAAGRGVAGLMRLHVPLARVPRAAAYFLYGIVANGVALYLLGLAGVPLTPVVFALPAATSVLAAAVLPRRLLAPARDTEMAKHPRAATVALAVPLVVLLVSAAILPMRDWDGRAMWLMKARAIAWEGSIDGRYFHGTLGLNQHNHYPLLLPLDAAAVMRLSGDLENEAARWMYVLIAVAGLLLTRELLARRFGSPSASWTAAAAAWLPAMAAVEGGALSACSDVALALFGGLPVLLLSSRERSSGDERAAGLLLAGAVLTKNEGVVAAAAVVAALFLTRVLRERRDRGSLAPAWVVAPPAIALALLSFWRTRVPQAYDERYDVLLRDLPRSLDQVPEVVRVVAARAFLPQAWGWFWPATLLALAIAVSGAQRSKLILPVLPMAAMMAAYVAVLSVTTWDLSAMANIAVDRLLTHLLVPASAVLTMGSQRVVEWVDARRGVAAVAPAAAPAK